MLVSIVDSCYNNSSLMKERYGMITYGQIVSEWHNRNIESGADLATVMNERCISFAYNSSKIENTHVTYRDTHEIFKHDGVSNYTGDLRTLFEIRNAKDANSLFFDAFDQKRELSVDLIKHFQKKLTENTYDENRWQMGERPGHYKYHDFVTGRDEVGALPEDVEIEMVELLEEMMDVKAENALIAAAYFHAKFENIHPFADGNGRTGRLALNYLLVLLDHPPIIIHAEDKERYYAALEAWDTSQSLRELTDFLKEQTVKTWGKRFDKDKVVSSRSARASTTFKNYCK